MPLADRRHLLPGSAAFAAALLVALLGLEADAEPAADRGGTVELQLLGVNDLRDGVKVGFVGVTTIDTPYFLLSEFARAYRWLDPSDSVNRWVPELRSRGVETIVVLAHAGSFQEGPGAAAGEIVDEARQMHDAVDVIVAGHTHSKLNLADRGPARTLRARRRASATGHRPGGPRGLARRE